MSYNDLSNCDCGDCADPPDCACHADGLGITAFKVPCYFDVIGWTGLCSETLTRLCAIYSGSNYFASEGWSPRVLGWSADLGYIWEWPDTDQCNAGVKTLSRRSIALVLSCLESSPGVYDWSLGIGPDGLSAGIIQWELNGWDPWGTQTDGVFTLDTVDELADYWLCADTLPATLTNPLSSLLPSTVRLRPRCFASGCAASEFVTPSSPTSCYTDSEDCSGNNTGSYYAPCTGDCSWVWNGSEWINASNTCSGSGCGCGPGPVCAGSGAEVLIESCYELITPSPPTMALSSRSSGPVIEDPPLIRKAVNLGFQILQSGASALRGEPILADEQTRKERLGICMQCPHSGFGQSTRCNDIRQDDGKLIQGCGCNLPAAIATHKKQCPIGKW